jgi:hypothetical protein
MDETGAQMDETGARHVTVQLLPSKRRKERAGEGDKVKKARTTLFVDSSSVHLT